jgi:hypothetical protein
LSLVSPHIFCVLIFPTLHYVINMSYASLFVTTGFHLDYNTPILYKRVNFNSYNKLHFLSHFISLSWNILTCTFIYLYFMLLFRIWLYKKRNLNICLNDFCDIFMFLYTLLRVTENQIVYLYYQSSDKNVNIEIYLRIILPLVKIYLWIFVFGCV